MNARMVLAIMAIGAALPLLGQAPTELLIRNGLIVTETGRLQADVRIRAGKIVEIGKNLSASAGARSFDATDKIVLPGGIDTHVHLAPVLNERFLPGFDDFESASRAALAGGITTIGAFIGQDEKASPAQTLTEAETSARKTTIADAILHFTIFDPTRFSDADLTVLRDRGISPKIFMRYMEFETNLDANLKLIAGAGKAGLFTQLHAEDAKLIQNAKNRLVSEGRTQLVGQNFPESHPVEAEEVATQRAIGFAEKHGVPIYLVHMSSERAMRAAEAARERGIPVFTEVRFIYLHLTREVFNRPDGPTFTGAPPLREQSDRDYLWGALARGAVDVINTDHVGYTRAVKMDPKNNIIDRRREGGNFLQHQMPLLYSEGVRQRRITLERMVAVTATNPAKLFGLYPQKGIIAVGSDADVVIWDPELKRTIQDDEVLSNGKFSVFSGWEVTGWPIVTIRRGEVAYENRRIVAAPGSGQLVPRTRWQRP